MPLRSRGRIGHRKNHMYRPGSISLTTSKLLRPRVGLLRCLRALTHSDLLRRYVGLACCYPRLLLSVPVLVSLCCRPTDRQADPPINQPTDTIHPHIYRRTDPPYGPTRQTNRQSSKTFQQNADRRTLKRLPSQQPTKLHTHPPKLRTDCPTLRRTS